MMKTDSHILVEGFAARMRREGLAASTVRQYSGFTAAFLAEFPGKHPSELTRDDVESYIDRVADGHAVSTTNLRMSALKRFYGYLVDREIVTGADPTARLKASKRRRHVNDWLRNDEDAALLAACITPQERILLALLRHAGLRIGEARSLRISDVDFTRRELRVRQSKSDSGLRTIPLEGELATDLAQWVEFLEKQGRAAPDAFVLSTTHGTAMQETHARRIVKRVAVRAGVRVTGPGRSSVSCHTLRRTFGSFLLNRGARLEVVSKLLGHAETSTTERHYAELLSDTVRDEFKKALAS